MVFLRSLLAGLVCSLECSESFIALVASWLVVGVEGWLFRPIGDLIEFKGVVGGADFETFAAMGEAMLRHLIACGEPLGVV